MACGWGREQRSGGVGGVGCAAGGQEQGAAAGTRRGTGRRRRRITLEGLGARPCGALRGSREDEGVRGAAACFN
jgi:hypothetical protein